MTSEDLDRLSEDRSGPSRRTLLKGAAWSVPVVVVGNVAPAMAVSDGPVTFTGESCKHPGSSQKPFNQDYHFVLDVANGSAVGLDVTITGVFVGGSEGAATARTFSEGEGVVPVNMTPITITVPAGGGTYVLHAGGDNSANSYMRVEYSIAGVPGEVDTTTNSSAPCTYPPTNPPCSGGNCEYP